MKPLHTTWLALLISLSSITGCGDDPPEADAQTTADFGYFPHDAANDLVVRADRGPADLASAGDRQLPEAGTLGSCGAWSAWTCAADPVMLCKASCSTGAKQYNISCTSSGHCVCGIAGSPCGPFTAAQPCDACRQALEGNCCLP